MISEILIKQPLNHGVDARVFVGQEDDEHVNGANSFQIIDLLSYGSNVFDFASVSGRPMLVSRTRQENFVFPVIREEEYFGASCHAVCAQVFVELPSKGIKQLRVNAVQIVRQLNERPALVLDRLKELTA